jgi:hypothetical protein
MSRVPRARIHPYLEPALAKQLAAYSAATGIASSSVVQAALHQYLDRTDDRSLMLRRLDRLGRAHERAHRDLEFLSEAFGVFVRLWLAYTPQIPDDAKQSARRTSESRFAQYIEHVVERFTGGHRFLDDLPREELADEAELTNLAGRSPAPSEAPGALQGARNE